METLRGSRKGLTLIELLVSLTVFLVVLLAIYQLFDTSHATYASGTRKQDVQQQARLAMDDMVRKIRMAGYIPENFDVNTGNDLTGTARIHLGTADALAVFGDLDGSGQSGIFLFCRRNGRLVAKRSTDNTDPNTYTCRDQDVTNGLFIGENVSQLRFTYFDANGNQLAADLDTKAAGIALNLTPRAQRDAVRAIVITLEITETVIRQDPQVYNLTSTVRLRNLTNS